MVPSPSTASLVVCIVIADPPRIPQLIATRINHLRPTDRTMHNRPPATVGLDIPLPWFMVAPSRKLDKGHRNLWWWEGSALGPPPDDDAATLHLATLGSSSSQGFRWL